MSTEQCDACGAEVGVAGGISGMWNTSHEPSGGMTLDLDDGSEHFLCFDCIEQLPDHPTAEDVAAISEP